MPGGRVWRFDPYLVSTPIVFVPQFSRVFISFILFDYLNSRVMPTTLLFIYMSPFFRQVCLYPTIYFVLPMGNAAKRLLIRGIPVGEMVNNLPRTHGPWAGKS